MEQLSKSRYTAYCQCPKNLWYRVYHPEFAAEVDPAAQARFETGSAVGGLAKRLFPGTVDVTTRNADGSLDLSAMIEKTRRLMDNSSNSHQFVPQGNSLDSQNSPLCIAEAAFTHNGCYCAVDLLRREGDGWAIYEVKSSTYKGEGKKGEEAPLVYLQDIAYQHYVLEQCGVKVTGTYLVRLDSGYVRGDELDIHGLFHINDVSRQIENEYLKLPNSIPAAKQVINSKEEPQMPIGFHCNNPYRCAFFDHCVGELPTPNVFDLYRMDFDKKCRLYREGKVDFESLRGEKLTERQQIQVECHLNNLPLYDIDATRQYLAKLSYPLYFLDFETMMDAVPPYKGLHPYQQVPFQYSLHYIEHEGGEIKHKEFLGESGTDPRRALAEQLCNDIPMGVCTTAYNMSFECGRLEELAVAFPDLAEHLRDIASHIVDLIDPFRHKMYYLKDMNGSFSIKKVLPALFPNDDSLNYKNLAGNVKNGGEAMTIFPQIKEMSPTEAAAARESLLRYCELDTWAMVKVWEKLRECVNV